jgi:hypothetical protein
MPAVMGSRPATVERLEDARREIYGRVVAGQLDPDRAAARLLAIEMEASGRGKFARSVRRSRSRSPG